MCFYFASYFVVVVVVVFVFVAFIFVFFFLFLATYQKHLSKNMEIQKSTKKNGHFDKTS